MPTIEQRYSIAATPSEVFAAITEQRHLAKWWTEDCKAVPRVASMATFEFKSQHTWLTFVVESLIVGRVVQWRCTGAAPDLRAWCGTTVRFALDTDGEHSTLNLTHRGFDEQDEAFQRAAANWRVYLGASLGEYLSTGTGRPIGATQARVQSSATS